MRLSLTALGWLSVGTIAEGATIEGVVAFPSQFSPPMTAYAFDLDTSRIHSVPVAGGQANFSVEVPPGRYAVFLAPNEAGAPNIYGAYTRYSLCAEQETGANCADHRLATVTVSAKGPRAAVKIDDWYLTDEVADQIDHFRGIATNAGAGPLSAPRFSEYPILRFDAPTAPTIDFGGAGLSAEERATVLQVMAGGPNFAGQVTATLTHCGAACARLVLVDWRRGALQEPPSLTEIQGTLPCRADEALEFRRDSRLLSITRMRGAAVVTQYYVWNPADATLALNAEYEFSTQNFCAAAAQ
jgi:hypothetical protein